MKSYLFICLFVALSTCISAQRFNPGEEWKDTDGVHINAHGGGVLFYNGTYYWYGTYMHSNTAAALKGVSVYSSKDLCTWKNQGIALEVEPDGSGHKIESGCLIERPKVVYNKRTKKFVMWFHLELKGKGYAAAEYGVAESSTPQGPFKFIYAGRSCSGIWPFNMTTEEKDNATHLSKDQTPKSHEEIVDGIYLIRDLGRGQMARDMSLFVDDNDKAYHIFSSEENNTLHLAELSDDYRSHTGKYMRILPGGGNEAPVLFKENGKYWLIMSGCTGWDPNPARLAVSNSIWGPWKELPNPCRGEGANKTFNTQGTFIFPVPGKKKTWVFMADRWNPNNLKDSRHIWLPVTFKDGMPELHWLDSWDFK